MKPRPKVIFGKHDTNEQLHYRGSIISVEDIQGLSQAEKHKSTGSCIVEYSALTIRRSSE